jgi:hypothetical protein
MSAIAPRDVARLCASVLDAQPFEEEQDIKGDPMGGHWGGVLQSDWDSAIHVVLELLIDRPPGAGDTGVIGLMAHVKQILTRPSVELRILHPDLERPASEYGDADTLRINLFAVMVLLRRMSLGRQWSCVQHCAQDCWDLFSPAPARTGRLAWPGNIQPGQRRDSGWIDLVQATRDELHDTKRFARRHSESSRVNESQRARLVQELRGFVLLSALPDDGASNTDPRLGRAKRALYEQLTGVEPSGCMSCDWPPFEYFEGANILIRHLHFLASRVFGAGNVTYDSALQFSNALFDGLVPSGASVKRLFHALGTVPQLKDIAGAAGLMAMPRRNLTSSKASTWKAHLHETRGPVSETRGLYCHMALATGMAVAALDRYAGVRPLDATEPAKLRQSTNDSLRALRALRLSCGDHVQGLAFAPHAIYNEVVLRCWLLSQQQGAAQCILGIAKLSSGVRYILSCQDDNGLFQQRYRTNERDEGESTATGVCLRSLACFARWLRRDLVIEGEPVRQLQRDLAHALRCGVEALLELQNDSGGFPTFAKTEREKHGLLATREGPGVQEYLLYDTPAADIVGWCLEGLCEFKSGAKEVPMLQLSPPLQRDIDRAIALAVGWLRRDFHPRAGWWARYGGGYVTGTALALRGLRVAGVPSSDPIFRCAASLLLSAQNAGGWDQDSQADDPAFNARPELVAMRGDPNRAHPTITAFGLMGLLDAGLHPRDPAVLDAVKRLVAMASEDGGLWHTDHAVHSFMRGWYYVDELQTQLKPVEALLRWAIAEGEGAA